MKIAVYTGGDINRASSRLRSYYVFKNKKIRNIKISRNKNFIDSLGYDVFHMHMLYKPRDIIKVIILRILNKIVIFDIDDNPQKFKHKMGFYFMANIASLVFFDTIYRKKYHQNLIFNKKKLHQINDVIDISSHKKHKSIKKKYNNGNCFIWFGNIENFHSIKKFYELIKNNKLLKLYLLSSFKKKKIKIKNIFYRKWKINLLFSISNKIDYAILSHFGNKDDLCKSENKMVLSIMAGLVPLVSNTPSYKFLADKLNAKKLVYKNFNQAFCISKKLSPKWKKKFIQNSRKYLISNYSSEVILNKIIDIICKFKKK